MAEGIPKKAGANSISQIVFSRPGRRPEHQEPEAVAARRRGRQPGGGAAVPARRAPRPATVPSSPPGSARSATRSASASSLLTVPGELYLVRGDAARRRGLDRGRVPAKVGPIDLGQVVLMNRVFLRESDNGARGRLHRDPDDPRGRAAAHPRVEIMVDRPGFFLNPTGCEPRHADRDLQRRRGRARPPRASRSTRRECAELPFGPKLRADRRRRRVRPTSSTTRRSRRSSRRSAGEADITQRARSCCRRSCGRTCRSSTSRARSATTPRRRRDTCPAKSTGRQRARVLAAAAVSDLRAGPHRPGDRERAAEGLRLPARPDRPRGAAEGAQQLPRGTPDHQHVRGGARPAAVLLRAEPQRRPRAASSTTSTTSAARRTSTARSTRPSRRTAARRSRRSRSLEIRGCEESDLRAASLTERQR